MVAVRRGARRARRGDVRTALLLVLAEEPRNGYELMEEIAQRSGGAWRPSPGSVYPALARLHDEGLVSTRDLEGRRVFELSDAGRTLTAARRRDLDPPWQRMRPDAPDGLPDLRAMMEPLASAVLEVQRVGSSEQRLDTAKHLGQTRRAIYRILAEDQVEN